MKQSNPLTGIICLIQCMKSGKETVTTEALTQLSSIFFLAAHHVQDERSGQITAFPNCAVI